MKIHLILTACIVKFGSTYVQPSEEIRDQTATSKVNDGSEIQENFQSLFDSIAENNTKRSEVYREALKYEVAKERQVFDTLREEIRTAQNVNSYKKRNFFKQSNNRESIKAIKRQTNDGRPIVVGNMEEPSPVKGTAGVTPSFWAPWRNLTREEPGMLLADKYRYGLKKTLDTLWVMICRTIDAEKYHDKLKEKDGREIENLVDLLDNMHSYLDHLADGISRMLANRDLNPWERADPLNTTIFNKLMDDWTEIKEIATQYKPKEAVVEQEKICKAANDALYDLPVRYKPIRQLVVEVQNQTWVSPSMRKEIAQRGEILFGIPF